MIKLLLLSILSINICFAESYDYYNNNYDKAKQTQLKCNKMNFKTEYAKQDCSNAAKALQSRTIKGVNTPPAKYGTYNVNADY